LFNDISCGLLGDSFPVGWVSLAFLFVFLLTRMTMTTEADNATVTEAKKYFDLHVTGLGYLNRVRDVEVTRGSNFLAVDISALHGSVDDVQYTRFDCRVSGSEADRVVRRCMPKMAADPEAKVLIGFRLGDVYPEIFTYKSGEKQGQPGISLKARLLKIGWVKINGETTYTAPPREVEATDEVDVSAEAKDSESSVPAATA